MAPATITTATNPSAAPAATDAAADRPVLVFDGACNFCRSQIARIRSRDDRDAFEYTPRQTEGLDQRFPQLAHGDFNTGVRLVETDGSVHVGADAIYHVARRVRGWRRLAWLYRVPVLKQCFRIGYAWVARNRYRLAGKCEDGACNLD